MQFEEAGNYIINRLKTELPAHLTYHNADHAVDVRTAAENIAKGENIGDDDMRLLLTAALYHDSGFLCCAREHETESCRIAKDALPRYGYSAEDIELICGMIMATRIPQSPKGLLEQILADADLYYLGRDDYFTIAAKLYRELGLTGVVNDDKTWDELQIQFIQKHSYFTKTAVNLRQANTETNIIKIKKAITK